MSKNSKIEWTDYTWSPWWGCTPVSPGCANCYAAGIAKRFRGIKYGKGEPRQMVKDWASPVRWDRNYYKVAQCNLCGFRAMNYLLHEVGGKYLCPKCQLGQFVPSRPRVFPSMMDWLDDEVPVELLAAFLNLIRGTPDLDWLLLTKRPGNWRPVIQSVITATVSCGDDASWMTDWRDGEPPRNIWIGVTAENQEMADTRIPELLKIPAKIRFISCEPLLGPVDIRNGIGTGIDVGLPLVEWVVCGGESGSAARPMHPGWARSLRDQCQQAGASFFFKQWGGENGEFEDSPMRRADTKSADRLLDGREHNEFPAISDMELV